MKLAGATAAGAPMASLIGFTSQDSNKGTKTEEKNAFIPNNNERKFPDGFLGTIAEALEVSLDYQFGNMNLVLEKSLVSKIVDI